MIITIIALQSIHSIKGNLDLRDLPSPAEVYDAVWRGDKEMYQNLLEKSRTICDSYGSLENSGKVSCILRWYNAALPKNHELTRAFSNETVGLGRDYGFLNKISKGDFSKIDLLLLIDHRKPIFFTDSWLRLLYNSKAGSNFDIVTPITAISEELRQKSENDSGPGPDYMYYSFEPRMGVSQGKFFELIKSLK